MLVKPIYGKAVLADDWYVFGPLEKKDTVISEELLEKLPKEIEVAGRKLQGQKATATAGKIDLAPLIGGTEAYKTCYVFIPVEVLEDGMTMFGMGADWWMQVWIDGREIFNNIKGQGNMAYPPSVGDHIVTADLKKGKHMLVVRFVSGQTSSLLAVGGPEDMRSYFKRSK